MKRVLLIAASLALVALTASLIYLAYPTRLPGHVDGAKLLLAAKTYAEGLKARSQPIPTSVSLRELLARELLTEADVSGFAGMEVTVSLTADENRPQEVLIRTRLADGHEIVALADGSVHSR